MGTNEFEDKVDKIIKKAASNDGAELARYKVNLKHNIDVYTIKPKYGSEDTDKNGEWHYRKGELVLRGFRYAIYSDGNTAIFADILEKDLFTPNILIEEVVLDKETMDKIINDLESCYGNNSK